MNTANAQTLPVYHFRLPETVSILFMLLYGLWLGFVLLCALALFAAVGFGFDGAAADFWRDVWFVLFIPCGFTAYVVWALRQMRTWWRNRRELPELKQALLRQPIPPRGSVRSPFVREQPLWLKQIQALRARLGKPENQQGVKFLIAAGFLAALMFLSWIEEAWYWHMLFWVALFCFIEPLPQIDYDPQSDVLTITRWNGQKEYDLRGFIGICTGKDSENGQYVFELIDQEQQPHRLFTSAEGTLDTLAQTLGRHTGLPLLQPHSGRNPFQAA